MAIDSSPLLQVTFLLLAPSGNTVAVNCRVLPLVMVVLVWSMVTPVTSSPGGQSPMYTERRDLFHYYKNLRLPENQYLQTQYPVSERSFRPVGMRRPNPILPILANSYLLVIRCGMSAVSVYASISDGAALISIMEPTLKALRRMNRASKNVQCFLIDLCMINSS